MSDRSKDEIRKAVRENYASVAQAGSSSCCEPAASCCSGAPPTADEIAAQLGYSTEELSAVPDGANMGLGCGNPRAIAGLKPGEVVVDLGSGGGLDCFLAAKQVGDTGRVIGVDMTPEMIEKARNNARQVGADNIEFRLGEIEHLPLADNSADVIISNCVINLSPDKPAVYADAFRVLRPGGRLAISDVVATAEMPEQIRDNIKLLAACVSGAAKVADLEQLLSGIGFVDVDIALKEGSREFIREWAPGHGIEDYVSSAYITARRPG